MQAWWESFFRGPYWKLQHAGYPAARTSAEVDFLVQALGLAPIESTQSSIRLFTYRELIALLREAGFREFRGVETLTGVPFELGSRRLSLIAAK